MKRKVSHAASQRAVSDSIVVAIELMNGQTGYGETLPRPYVTGETTDSVIRFLKDHGPTKLLEFHPTTFAEALEQIDEIPFADDNGQPIPAARAALELALLDAYSMAFDRSLTDITGWLGTAGFGEPGSINSIRYSGVLATESITSLKRNLKLLRLFGLRDFKLKVGMPDDDLRLKTVLDIMGRSLQRGIGSLRLDANGAWSTEQAIETLNRWHELPIAGIEQPLAKDDQAGLAAIVARTGARIIHDESLVTMDDAILLHEQKLAYGFNIRVSKCGGLLPSLRLAAYARRNGIAIQLGCMVGETSILSAAGVRFLQCVPGVRWAEGCFGSFLMEDDVARRSLRFRLKGRPPKVGPSGLGVDVDQNLLEKACLTEPLAIEL